ncbi:MAG: heme-binding protein [Anaerolineaceae bacterium]|nr:heme-binding protein [Anaerolineaceae bacterium]
MLEEIEKEEFELALPEINQGILLELGLQIARQAIEEKLPICLDIHLGEICAFHFCAEGSTPNTENWVRRKRQAVDFFGHSTAWLNEKIQGDAALLVSKYGLKDGEYTCVPGGYPLLLKGFGKVGTMAVSGLSPEKDQSLITQALRSVIQLYN